MKQEIKIELVDGGYILSYPVPEPNVFGLEIYNGKLIEKKAIVKTRKELSKRLETILNNIHDFSI